MSMTRKHYEAIASDLADTYEMMCDMFANDYITDGQYHVAIGALDMVRGKIARTMARDNANFDADRFHNACIN